jgi:hypothetical protein
MTNIITLGREEPNFLTDEVNFFARCRVFGVDDTKQIIQDMLLIAIEYGAEPNMIEWVAAPTYSAPDDHDSQGIILARWSVKRIVLDTFVA